MTKNRFDSFLNKRLNGDLVFLDLRTREICPVVGDKNFISIQNINTMPFAVVDFRRFDAEIVSKTFETAHYLEPRGCLPLETDIPNSLLIREVVVDELCHFEMFSAFSAEDFL